MSATFSGESVVICDRCGDRQAFAIEPTLVPGTQLGLGLRKAGWSTSTGRDDYCADCTKRLAS